MNRAVKTILFFLVVIALIWLIVALLVKAFSGNKSSVTQQKVDLASYATTDATTTMYIDGPVEADQEHQAFKIAVDRNQVNVVLYKGYDGQVTKQMSYPNNVTSYTAFLKSLDKAQFSRAVLTSVGTDERGYCPLRNRFIYTMENANSTVIKAWTTSCGVGNYSGQRSLTRTLFLDQVPQKDLREFLNGTGFSTN